MQIINYTISALVLLIVVLLFLRAALPHAEAPIAESGELTPKELEFKISVLAMNSTTLSPRGGGVGIRRASRTLRRFYRRMSRKGNGPTDGFERIMLGARAEIERAIEEVESRSSGFFSLPHKGGYPRVYTLCLLLVSGGGGYIGSREIRRAIEITNEHSALGIDELKALEYMLKACYIERLAATIEKALSEKKLKRRAEKDLDSRRVNLSMLKFDAYVSVYASKVEPEFSRKFSALCLENGVDVAAATKSCEVEKAKRAAAATAAVSGINEASENFPVESVLELYAAYGYFAEKCADFSGLPARGRLSHIEAFSRLCKRKKENEVAAARTADGDRLYSALEKEMPGGYVFICGMAPAFVIGAFPAALLFAVGGGAWLLAAALSLPVTLAAVFGLTGRFSRFKAEQMGWTTENKPSLSEFSADYAQSGAPSVKKSERGKASVSFYLSAAERISKALEAVAPVFAVALAVIAPLYSAYLLFLVFSREIVRLAADVKDALGGRANAAKAAASALVAAASLPLKAAESVARIFGKELPFAAKVIVSVSVSALIVVTSAVFGGSPVFYFLAAAFALSPLAQANFVKAKPKDKAERQYERDEPIRSYDDYGALPAVAFIRCGDYLCMSSERGGGRDVYRGSVLFKEMRLYAKDGDGRYVPFTFVPPYLVGEGRTVNNALCVGNTFAVETSGFDGGKRITVTAHGCGDFEIACVHLATGRCEPTADSRIFKIEGIEGVYVSATADGESTASAESGERFCEGRRREGSVLSIETRTCDGKATFAICCEIDGEALARKIGCIFRDGFFMRGDAFASALSRPSLFTPAVCDIASFALYGICRYDAEFARYVDVRFPSVVCVLRAENGLARLRRRLKRLALVRSLCLPFNVVVVCFDGSEHFFGLKDKISVMFAEYGLDKNGSAVCLDCANNSMLYEKIVGACEKDEDVRRRTRLPCPDVRSFKRSALPVSLPQLVSSGEFGGVSENGEGIYVAKGKGRASENIVADGGFGFVVRADATSSTFDDECALTGEPDSLCTLPAESVTLGENGRVWGFAAENASFCAHGGEGSKFVCTDGGLYSELSVRLIGDAKTYTVTVKNPRRSTRKLRAMLVVRPVLGDGDGRERHVIELGECERGACAVNRLTGKSLYVETDAENFERSLFSESVTSENGVVCRVENLGGGFSPALVISSELRVKAGAVSSVSFALSKGGGFGFVRIGSEEIKPYSSFVCGDEKLDIFVSALRAQVKTSLEYVPLAGDGYAEKLVKCAALLPNESEKMRSLIFAACDNRFANGDILLTRKGNKGERAPSSGASLFLPMSVARYIDCTDDRDVLFERRRYLESVNRRLCRAAKETASVLEHCLETLFALEKGSLTPCFGIDSRLLALRALGAFMPLVRDGESRLRLAEIKTRLSQEVRNIDAGELSAADLSWLCITREGKPSTSALLRKSDGAGVQDLVWLSAALLERGESDAAYSLLKRINPIESRGDTPFIPSKDGLSPELGITPAIVYMLLTEGFYGCKTRGEAVTFSPSLPSEIERVRIEYSDGKCGFEVSADNTGGGKWRLFVDGISYNSLSVKKTAALVGRSLELKRR